MWAVVVRKSGLGMGSGMGVGTLLPLGGARRSWSLVPGRYLSHGSNVNVNVNVFSTHKFGVWLGERKWRLDGSKQWYSTLDKKETKLEEDVWKDTIDKIDAALREPTNTTKTGKEEDQEVEAAEEENNEEEEEEEESSNSTKVLKDPYSKELKQTLMQDYKEGRQMFEKLKAEGKAQSSSYFYMLISSMKQLECDYAISVFNEMKEKQMQLSLETHYKMIDMLAQFNKVDAVESIVLDGCFQLYPNHVQDSALKLLTAYDRSGSMDKFWKMMNVLDENTMTTRHYELLFKNSEYAKAKQKFEQLKENNFELDPFVYSGLFLSAAKANMKDEILELYKELLDSLLPIDNTVWDCLAQFYNTPKDFRTIIEHSFINKKSTSISKAILFQEFVPRISHHSLDNALAILQTFAETHGEKKSTRNEKLVPTTFFKPRVGCIPFSRIFDYWLPRPEFTEKQFEKILYTMQNLRITYDTSIYLRIIQYYTEKRNLVKVLTYFVQFRKMDKKLHPEMVSCLLKCCADDMEKSLFILQNIENLELSPKHITETFKIFKQTYQAQGHNPAHFIDYLKQNKVPPSILKYANL